MDHQGQWDEGQHEVGWRQLTWPACCLTKECYPAGCCPSVCLLESLIVEGCGHVVEGGGGGQRSRVAARCPRSAPVRRRRIVHMSMACRARSARPPSAPIFSEPPLHTSTDIASGARRRPRIISFARSARQALSRRYCTRRYSVVCSGRWRRSEQARHRAPAGAAAPWLARWAPEVVSPYGLKPRTASQSPCQAPTCGCLLAGACLRVASSWSPTARAWSGKMSGSCPWPAPAVDTGSSRVFARTNKSKANSPAQPRTHQRHPTYKCFL